MNMTGNDMDIQRERRGPLEASEGMAAIRTALFVLASSLVLPMLRITLSVAISRLTVWPLIRFRNI